MDPNQQDIFYNFTAEMSDLRRVTSSVQRLLNNYQSQVTKISTGVSKTFKGLDSVFKAATNTLKTLTGVSLSSWFAGAANESIEYAETLNLFTVAMGKSIDVGEEFVSQMSELYGMDPSNLMRYAGNFYQLSDAIGMPNDAAAHLSLGLTKAANDIASLFNRDIETVFDNLSSGLQGMSRAVRKYGLDIRATTLEQTALSIGLDANVETMSEANRQGLRFITMMRQASNASGDFARTIETPANQLRIFKEQMSQLGRAVGDLFISPLGIAVQHINGFIMALRMAIVFLGTLLNVTEESTTLSGDFTESLDSVSDAASTAAKKVKQLLAPFDELNVLRNQDSGLDEVGNLDPTIAEAMKEVSWELENIRMKANEVRDSLLRFFGFKFDATGILAWDPDVLEQNLIGKFPQWSQTIHSTFSNWSGILEGFKQVLQSLEGVAYGIWSRIFGPLKQYTEDQSVASWIDSLTGSLNALSTWIDSNSTTIADFTFVLSGFVIASKALASLASVLIPVISFLQGIGALGYVAQAAGWITAIVGAVVLLSTYSTAFSDSLSGLFTTLWDTVQPIGENLLSLFYNIGTGIRDMWEKDAKPTIESIGDMLAPILNTLGVALSDIGLTIEDIIQRLKNLFSGSIKPLVESTSKAVQKFTDLVKQIWTEVLDPVIQYISAGLRDLWLSTLGPLSEDVTAAITGLAELLNNLWTNVLQPVVSWLVTVLGPTFKVIFEGIWDVIQFVVGLIGSILGRLANVFRNLIEFLNGVFTGDWRRALNGLLNIFVGLGNGIISIFENVVNFCISLINTFVKSIYGAIQGVVNGIGSLIEGIAALAGKELNLQVDWTAPSIPKVSIPRIPTAALATGGVVTSPTYAMIGEGRYDEAVIPLGNSPQINELINRIAEATKGSKTEPIQINVYIGNEQVAEYIHQADRRNQLQTNGGT